MQSRLLLFISILFISTSSLFAQDFNGGILGGLATSEVSGDRLQGPHKAGLYIGGFVNRYFSQRSSFQMELDYIQKGSRENPKEENNYYSYLLRLNYIEIPVSYKYDFHPNGTLETGLSLGVLVNYYEEANGSEQVAGAGDFETFDLSFNIGAYYTLVENLRINIRYSNSLLPIRPHAGGTSYRLNQGQYNEVLSFVLFYGFSSR
jgi:hypothetical protein